MTYSIDQVNQMKQADFVAVFGPVFEETPEIAKQVWRDRQAQPKTDRPFKDVLDLHQKMVAVVENLTADEQLQLIRAHPELGARKKMAEASVQEQAEAGLSQLNSDDQARMAALNSTYRQRFGVPFVMAVKGFNQGDILAALEERLEGDKTTEKVRSLFEICKIARFRLDELISS